MQLQHYKTTLALAWVLVVSVVGLAIGGTSVPAIAVLGIAALLPPVIMLRVWQDPGESISESIHEARR